MVASLATVSTSTISASLVSPARVSASAAVATTSTAVTTATASTTALGERRRTREDPGRQAQSDQSRGKIAQNGPVVTIIHRHAPLLRFPCDEETGTGIAVGDPVESGFPAIRYPYYTQRAR